MGDEPLTPNEAAALAELEWELSAPHTLEEIAEHLGISRFAAARIEKRALAKMRAAMPDGWEGRVREPAPLSRCLWNVYPSDGAASKLRAERDGA